MPSLLASLEAQTHLARTTDTRAFLCARPLVLLTERLQEAIPGSAMIVVPELEDWLGEEEVSEYEYKKTWEEAREDPFAIYHTSGSSGLSPRFFLAPIKTWRDPKSGRRNSCFRSHKPCPDVFPSGTVEMRVLRKLLWRPEFLPKVMQRRRKAVPSSYNDLFSCS